VAGADAHSRLPTFARAQKARLVAPASPLAARGALSGSRSPTYSGFEGRGSAASALGGGLSGVSGSDFTLATGSAASAVGADSGKANVLTRGGVAHGGPWGASYGAATAASGDASLRTRSTVRQPSTYADTLKLLEEKPDEVPRAVVQVGGICAKGAVSVQSACGVRCWNAWRKRGGRLTCTSHASRATT
jgi:hypothetical protein